MAGTPSVVIRFRDRQSAEAGTSLVEVVIVAAVSLVILGGVLSMLESGTKAERATQARHSALLDLRAALVRIDKEVRQATSVASADSGDGTGRYPSLNMCTYIGGSPIRVSYSVTNGNLTRAIASTPGATCSLTDTLGTAVTMASRVTSTAPFCYISDPTVGTCMPPGSATKVVQLSIAGSPDVSSAGAITLATSIELRNPQQ
jgi:Tfp pilus assembly protein PilW